MIFAKDITKIYSDAVCRINREDRVTNEITSKRKGLVLWDCKGCKKDGIYNSKLILENKGRVSGCCSGKDAYEFRDLEYSAYWCALAKRHKTFYFQNKKIVHPTYIDTNNLVFYHSGDLGDIIYSLPIIKKFGGGEIILGPNLDREPYKTREKMTHIHYKLIADLLACQPYIKNVRHETQYPINGVIDLNQFRWLLTPPYYVCTRNLVDCVSEWFGLGKGLWKSKWLDFEPKRISPIIIGRSARYHNPDFNWKLLLDFYAGKITFLGTKIEWQEFCYLFDINIPWYETKTLNEAAQIIAGCDLFIGNQSSLFAIAEGLKKKVILEYWPQSPNCKFPREDSEYGITELSGVGGLVKPTINWQCLYDYYSGLGRINIQLIERIHNFHLRVIPTRTTEEFVELPFKINTYKTRVKGLTYVSEAITDIGNYISGGEIAMCMWESTRLFPGVKDALNKCRLLIVPNSWCASCFSAEGVNVPIHIIGLGINPKIFYPKAITKRDTITFAAAGRIHGQRNVRKRLDQIITWFQEAFPSEKNVRLNVRYYGANYIYIPDSRIRISNRFLDDEELANWYREADVFINLSSGGGWELHLHEAMACGAVGMSPYFSGCMEFFNPNNGFAIDYEFREADGNYAGCGSWCFPVKDSCIETMRQIYKNRSLIDNKRVLAIESAGMYTIDKMASKITKLLQEYV